MQREVPVFCGKDCGGNACPLLATIEEGRVVRLRDNPAAGPFLKPCPRGYVLHRAHYAPDRLRLPLIAAGPRGSGLFREASWEEALDLVASRLNFLRARHGANSLLCMGGAGSTGALHGTGGLLARFQNARRPHGSGPEEAATFLSGSYSNGAARFALPYLFGDAMGESGFDAATALDSRLIVLWGANPLEARLGAELGEYLKEAARRGTPVVCIDPRRSLSCQVLGARWLPVLPGSDAALMLALLREFFAQGGVDLERAAALAQGLEELEAYVCGRADGVERGPAWAEPLTGLPAAAIRDLARSWLEAKPAMLIPGYAIQRVFGGEDPFRLAVALQVASGNFGRRGGSTGSLNNKLPRLRVGSLSSLSLGDEPSAPVLRWPDLILEGRSGGYAADIKAAYLCGSNFANQGADVRKSLLALSSLEFSVCHEHFLTPSAALCDVVLPAASPLEKEDLGVPWAGDYLLYKAQAVEAEGQARSDYEIFASLSARLGCANRFTEGKDAKAWIESFIAAAGLPDPAAFRESGFHRGPERFRAGLDAFASDPAAHPLPTPSGKVELLSERYARETGRPALPIWEAGAGRPGGPEDHGERKAGDMTAPEGETGLPLSLVTPKTLRRTHSQDGGGIPWTGSRADFGELSLCPADAARAGLAEGEPVRVWNARGSLRARTRISADLMPGVACLHEGVWFDLSAALRGEADPAASANLLSSTEGSGPATAAVMHGLAVRVAPA